MAEHTACPDIFASRAHTAFSPIYDKTHKHIFFQLFYRHIFSLLSFSLDNGGETSHQLGNYDRPTD